MEVADAFQSLVGLGGWGWERPKRSKLVIKKGSDKTVNQDRRCVSGKRRAEMFYVTEMKESRAGHIVDMRVKIQWAVKDDTETLNLRAEERRAAVDSKGLQSGFHTDEEKFCFHTLTLRKFEVNKVLISEWESSREVRGREESGK